MNTRRGFTLIELLVAISLATIITLLGVSLMRTSINSSVGNEEALKQSQAVRDTQRLIEYAWSGRQSNGFDAGKTQLEFISSQTATGSFPLRFVCQSGEHNDFALWFYQVSPPGERTDGPAPAGEMLLAGLSLCKFGWLQAPPDDKAVAVWREEWPADRVPPAVMRLDLATSRGPLPPLIFSASGA
ncbi:MAG: type II secretion system protein [Sterolibacterium sp.]|jgi:prepilin-type N-terminal cleavage/methylation domain-containing protein